MGCLVLFLPLCSAYQADKLPICKSVSTERFVGSPFWHLTLFPSGLHTSSVPFRRRFKRLCRTARHRELLHVGSARTPSICPLSPTGSVVHPRLQVQVGPFPLSLQFLRIPVHLRAHQYDALMKCLYFLRFCVSVHCTLNPHRFSLQVLL